MYWEPLGRGKWGVTGGYWEPLGGGGNWESLGIIGGVYWGLLGAPEAVARGKWGATGGLLGVCGLNWESLGS